MTTTPFLDMPESDPRMFRINQSDADKVTISGGKAVRFAGGGWASVDLTTDTGASYDPDDVKTETIADPTVYIYAMLDSAYSPTTLVIEQKTAEEIDTDEVYCLLGVVTFADGVITKIVQAHEGIWMSYYMAPDDLSVNYGTSLAQIYEWDDAALTTTPLNGESDGFTFNRGCSGGTLEYASPYQIVAAGEGGTSEWTWDNLPGTKHSDLEDIVANYCADDHHGEFTQVTGSVFLGNVPYIANEGGYIRNSMVYGLGDVLGANSVGSASRKLYSAVTDETRLDWDLCQASSTDPYVTFDWDLCLLKQKPWTVENTTPSTSSADGSLIVAGGIGVAENVFADGGFEIDESNYWKKEALLIEPTGTVGIGAATDMSLGAAGNLALSWGTLTLQGESFTLMPVQVPDGSGGTKTIEVLARVI